MEKIRIKSSTIWVGTGAGVDVYRSLEEVPARLRAQLNRNVESDRAVTILIADRRGREELVRSLASKSMAQRESEDKAAEAARQEPFFNPAEIFLFAIVLLVALSIFFVFQQ